MNYQIINGNNIDVLKTFPDNHFDSIVTDPPYGIDFLGKAWDANTGALETYQECLRVLKPGGHILAFSAARTYHHLAITLEQAGFEIRDQIMWIYSSGFPKSQDIGKSIERTEKKRADNALGIKRSKIESGPKTNCPKCNKTLNGTNQNTCEEEQCDLRDALAPAQNEWAGWGTALKPAHEPICMARKPIKLSIAKNCQTHGVGALNIDATRVPYESDKDLETYLNNIAGPMERGTAENGTNIKMHEGKTGFKVQKGKVKRPSAGKRTANFADSPAFGGQAQSGGVAEEEWSHNEAGRFPSNVIGEIAEPYQKYFYCPKVSRRERHTGFDLDSVPTNEYNDPSKVKEHPLWDESIGSSVSRLQDKIRKMNPPGNNHPTVKPIELMKYLIKLITPEGGIVLDPFNGSGSTGCAAVELGHEYVGIELDPKYCEIATKRIEAWNKRETAFEELFE